MSRLLVIPVAIVTFALLYGLTIDATERKDYVETLMDPLRWVSLLPGGSDASTASSDLTSRSTASGSPSQLPVPSSVPVSAGLTGDSASAAANAVDTTANTAGGGSEGAGSWVTVQQGQTLYDIARQEYGTESAWKRIWLYNLERLPNPTNVRYGMELYMPPPGELSDEESRRVDQLLAELS